MAQEDFFTLNYFSSTGGWGGGLVVLNYKLEATRRATPCCEAT